MSRFDDSLRRCSRLRHALLQPCPPSAPHAVWYRSLGVQSHDVPQASSLRLVRAVVDALASGADSAEEVAKRTQLSRRHAVYYRRAAEILGWARPDQNDPVTPVGLALLGTRPGTGGEIAAFRFAIRRSSLLAELAPDLLAHTAPPLDALADRIRSATALSRSTARRRASTLLSWRRQIMAAQTELELPDPVSLDVEQRMLLRSVSLERFKAAFRPPPIPLSPFTVVIGRNGSGKSTLLEALQWIDKTMRQDARDACDRYFGIHDLINLRSQTQTQFFEIALEWCLPDELIISYRVAVEEAPDSTPAVAREELWSRTGSEQKKRWIVQDDNSPRARLVRSADGTDSLFDEPDRLALARLARLAKKESGEPDVFGAVQDFWARAVFLRLSPSKLAQGSPAKRKSYEPLLDEEGQNLPALISSLTLEQRDDLVASVQAVMPDIRGISVSRTSEREQRSHYSLKERMPYRGRRGKRLFDIPAWMLSEGTRRITALYALAALRPGPSLLCIEEIENGLDPWTVRAVLAELRSAADRGVQVVLTTHSPWILDHVPLESILYVKRQEGETEYRRFREVVQEHSFDPSIPPGTAYTNLQE